MKYPIEITRRRAIGLAIVLLLGFGGTTFLVGRRANRMAQAPAAVQDSIVRADSAKAADVQTDLPKTSAAEDSVLKEIADSTAQAAATSSTTKYRAGEDPEYAKKMGWPVNAPVAAGAIVPNKRIVAYYGNPLSKRMGALGEYEPQEMLRRLDREVQAWSKADPSTPVQPALHLIAVVAQGDAGPSGKYRVIMRDTLVEQVYGWAKSRNAILIIDIQTGHSDIRELLPKFEHFLKRPDVHLAVDPEFMMKSGVKPGAKIGTMDASDINYASAFLADIVKKYNLPPKVLVIHRFTRNMVTNAKNVQLRPEVQIVMDMDGWGAPWLKRDSYKDYIVKEPVQFTGFKLFYHNDTKKGDPLLTPAEVLKLEPKPVYIQYQ